MGRLEFKISQNCPTPVFALTIGMSVINVLNSSVATLTVWTGTTNKFHKVFPNAKYVKDKKLKTLSGTIVSMPMYVIPCLEIGTEYHDVPIVIDENRFTDIDMVMSNSIFLNAGGVCFTYGRGRIEIRTDKDVIEITD